MPPSTTENFAATRRSTASGRNIALWLFATFQFFYLATSTGRVRTADEYNTLYTTESLVLHGTTAVPQAVSLHNFYGRHDVHGQPRAAYPPGQAVACAPWYGIGQYVIARLPGVPADDTDVIVAFAATLSSATFAALTVTFFFLLLEAIAIPRPAALMAAAMLGLATPIFAYSAWLFSEPLSAAIFTISAWILFAPAPASLSPSRAAAAGALLGLTTLVRPTNVLAVAIFAIAILASHGKAAFRTVLIFGACAALGVALLLVHNTILFGSPLSFGYPTAAEGAKQLNHFDTPLLTGLYGFLFSPGKSLFIFAPPTILAIFGLTALWRRSPGLATLAILFPLTDLFFFAKYSQWEGGYCVGPRYLVPALVFLCLGLGTVLAQESGQNQTKSKISIKTFAVVLLVLGAFVQLISLATSFMEDQVPRGRYYAANWTYRLDYSLSGPIHLFWKYLASPQPVRLGLGWDRWFVFLAKAGVSRVTLAVFGAAIAGGLAISLIGLSKSVALAPEKPR